MQQTSMAEVGRSNCVGTLRGQARGINCSRLLSYHDTLESLLELSSGGDSECVEDNVNERLKTSAIVKRGLTSDTPLNHKQLLIFSINALH